jgi:aspartate/methionine/tyrosine aminotransferase
LTRFKRYLPFFIFDILSKKFFWKLSFLVFEPAYDSYVSQIKMAGAVPFPVVLELDENVKTSAGYILNIDAVKSKITSKTKMLVLNKY